MSQEGEAEFIRVQKKSFFDTLFFEERIAIYSAESFGVSFFLSEGRLFNKNISNDI